jgi:hypothetical protein
MPRSLPTWRIVLVTFLAALGGGMLVSCTGVGDGGSSSTDQYLNRGADITSDPRPADHYVWLRQDVDDRDSFCVAVDVDSGLDVFSAAFTLTYDTRYVRPASYSVAGGCLGLSGSTLPPQVDWSRTPGQIVVGLTRDASSTTTGVSCGHLIDICFDILDGGTSTLGFSGSLALLQPDGTAVVGIDSSDFIEAELETRH